MEQLSLFEPLSRTERQKEGLREWIKHGCKGTLSWSTGVGKSYAASEHLLEHLAYQVHKVLLEVLIHEWAGHLDDNSHRGRCVGLEDYWLEPCFELLLRDVVLDDQETFRPELSRILFH